MLTSAGGLSLPAASHAHKSTAAIPNSNTIGAQKKYLPATAALAINPIANVMISGRPTRGSRFDIAASCQNTTACTAIVTVRIRP